MNAQMILVAGPYRSGTNDDPLLVALARAHRKAVYFAFDEVPHAD